MTQKILFKTQLSNTDLPVVCPPAMYYSFWSLLLLSYTVPFTWGWGDIGHRTVAYLAEKYLNEDGTRLVEDLIRPDETFDISDAAVWPDLQKWKFPFTRPWHFIGMY